MKLVGFQKKEGEDVFVNSLKAELLSDVKGELVAAYEITFEGPKRLSREEIKIMFPKFVE